MRSDSPWVGACFDTGNALWYGFPEHWIPVLGSRIRRVHLKDNRIVGHSGVVPTPLLAGDVNWPAVRESLRGIGYDGWVTAEVFPPYRHHAERLIYETSASMDAILVVQVLRTSLPDHGPVQEKLDASAGFAAGTPPSVLDRALR